MKSNKHFLLFAFVLIILFIQVSAHPGKTDSRGGHWDRNSGTYHFHTGEYAGKGSSGDSFDNEYVPFTPPYEPPEENPYQAKDDEAEGDVISHKASPWFVLIVSVFLLLYVIITCKSAREDIHFLKKNNNKIFSLEHPVISWYFLYSIVFFIVVLISMIKKETITDINNNIIFSAIISVLSPIVIVIVALVYVRIKDEKYARRFTQNGCDVAEASDEEVVYQGDKNKYNPKHPYWPLFYMYGFYMLLLIVALYISSLVLQSPFKDIFDIFLHLFLSCTIGFVMLPIVYFIPLLVFATLAGKCLKIKNATKVLVCRNCNHRNSIMQNYCEKCGINFRTYKQFSYLKMLDDCCISSVYHIDPQCYIKVASDLNYTFLNYNVSKYSKEYLLRVDNQHNNIVFFGDAFQFNCIFRKHLFSVNKISEPHKKHFVLQRDVYSGETIHNFWFSPGTLKSGEEVCQDSVKNMYVNGGKLIIEVHRTKAQYFPAEFEKYLKSRYNVNTDYIITVTYECGRYEMTKSFPNIDDNLLLPPDL